MDKSEENRLEKIHVEDSEYQKFIQLAKDATIYAYENELGIWKEK